MPRVADHVEGVKQSVLVVRLECKVKVDRGLSVRVADALLVLRNDTPCMHHPRRFTWGVARLPRNLVATSG